MATVPRVPPTDAYAGHYIRPDDDRLHVSVGGIRVPASIGTPSGKRYSATGGMVLQVKESPSLHLTPLLYVGCNAWHSFTMENEEP